MKFIIKILTVALILVVFIGTIFFLYNKSRKKPVVFKTTTPFETSIIKKTEEKGAIQFEIKAKLRLKSSHFIRAGYSANADIVLDKKDKVLAINESLLQFESETAFVEVETAPQHFEKRYIELGLSDGINIEVISGLTAEDKIKIWNSPLRENKGSKSE
jgi:hypothetical protein